VNFDRVMNIVGSIVMVGLVTVVVTSPNTAKIVSSAGNAFTNSLATAMGRRH